MRRIFLVLLAALLVESVAGGQERISATNDSREQAPAAQMTIRPVPPEILKRTETLRALVQPSVKAWVSQQVRIEERQPVPDANALRKAIRQRFAGSLSHMSQSDSAVEAIVILVITEMLQDGDGNLSRQMHQAQEIMQLKQALRQTLDQAKQETAAVKSNERNSACATPFCRSLPSKLAELADAFARLWDKRGQFGQFVNVETGDLCVGGSTAGAIVPGAMALASQTFHERRYLKVAEAAARKYYKEYVRSGYTTGGPGEILSAPDSESAFGLFESFMALHDITGSSEWLRDAEELLPICASWTVAYDYRFPTNSAMGRIGAHSCGAVWANVQNKHGAPAICTWSGDSLLKYYRATGDRRALELLTDIAHGVPQYISRTDHPIGRMPPGGMCERVNLSAWEGTQNVGGSILGSCSWVETAALLTVAQLPGLYVRPDTGLAVAFDNVRVEELSHTGKTVKFRLTNPTKFAANVSVLAESARAARRPVGSFVEKPLPVVHLDPGASTTLEYTASSSSKN